MTFDSELGNLVGMDGTTLPVLRAGDRVGYEFIGWASTMSNVDPKNIRRSERQANTIKRNTLFRATSNLTFYALWNNKEYRLHYNIHTRNYSSAADEPTLTVPQGREKVYFDCVFGGDGEQNGPVAAPQSLPSSEGGQFAFRGWYYDQTYYKNGTGGIRDVATPTESTKVLSNSPVFTFDILNYILNANGWTEATIPADGLDINGWYAGRGRTLFINPNGGSLWFGGKSDAGQVGRRYAATTSFITEIEVSNGTNINEGGADALPENANVWFQNLSDNQDAISRKGYTFNGWKTVQHEGHGATYNGYVTGTTPYWSDAENSYLRAEWTPRRYYIKYNVNMPKKPGSTTENASTRDLLRWRHVDGTQNEEVPSDKIVTYDTIIAPDSPGYATFSTPTLPGYTFRGWYVYKKVGSQVIKTRLDVGSNRWTYGDFEKFCDPTGTTEDYIVCEDYPAESYFPAGETRGIRKLNIFAEWEANEYKLVFDGYKGQGSTDYKFTIGGVEYNGTPATVSVTFDTRINSGTNGATKWPTSITRKGYTAKGWYAVSGQWPGDWTDITDTGWYRPVSNTTEYGYQLARDYNSGDDDQVTMNNFNGVVTLRPIWYPDEVTVTWDARSISTASTVPYVRGAEGSYSNYMLYDDTFGTNRIDRPVGPNTAIGITTVWPASGRANEGTIIGVPYDVSDIYMPGYRFVNWNTRMDGSGETVSTNTKVTPSTADMSLKVYAMWQPVRHKIHLNKNDSTQDPSVYGTSAATLTPNTDEVYAYFDLDVPELATPSRTGYDFKGWYTKDGVNDGTWSGDWGVNVKKGAKYNWRNNTSALYDLNDSDKSSFRDPTYEHTLELYAKWEPKRYNVNFYMNDSRAGNGSTEGRFNNVSGIAPTASPATLYVYYDRSLRIKDYTRPENAAGRERTDDELPLATKLTRLGYTINASPWTLNPDGTGTAIDFAANYTVDGDTNYYANWDAATWKVIFNTLVQSTLRPHVAKAAQANIRAMVHSNDVDSIAAIAEKEVTFDAPAVLTETAVLSSANAGISVVGYGFNKWCVDRTYNLNNKAYAVNENITINKELLDLAYVNKDETAKTVTLYPTFTENNYTITFNNNYDTYGVTDAGYLAETFSYSPRVASYNELVLIPDPIDATGALGFTGADGGLEFTGWSPNAGPALASTELPEYPISDNREINITRLAANGDVNLYAHWRPKRFTIDYQNDNPTVPWANVTANVPTWYDASSIEMPVPGVGDAGAPERAGAEFLYWTYQFYDDEAGTIPNANVGTSSVAMNQSFINSSRGRRLKLTANWKVLTGMLVFDPNGGVGQRVLVDIADGAAYYQIPNTGFTFGDKILDHWSTDPNDANGVIYTTVVDNIYRESTDDDYIVYAIWKLPRNTAVNNNSVRNDGKSSRGSKIRSFGGGGSGGGGGGGGGGGALGQLNQNNLQNAVMNNSPFNLSLAISNNSLLASNGKWVFQPTLNKWQFVTDVANINVNVGNTTVGLQMLAMNGIYSLPDGLGGVGLYLFDGAGCMQTGLQDYAGATYYFALDGKMQTGWQLVNGMAIYFANDGKMMYNLGNVLNDEAALKALQAQALVAQALEAEQAGKTNTTSAAQELQNKAFLNADGGYQSLLDRAQTTVR